MKMKFTIFIFVCLLSFSVSAQSYFNKLYDYDQTNTHNNAASSCYEYSNGDFLISTTKFYSSSFGALQFIKINSLGDTLFHKQYFKLNCAYYTAISGSLIKCFDGNLVQAGVYYDSTLTNADAFVVKLTEAGDTLWTRTFGGIDFDNANIVCQTLDSGFVLMGVTQSFSMGPASDFFLIKIDKNGNFVWQQNYGTTGTEECVSGQTTLDGGFILSGHRNNQLHIVKTDSNGNFEWEKVYSGTAGQAFVKQLSDSTYILVGSKSVVGLSYQAYMAKLTKLGVIIWSQTYGGAGDQQFYAIPIILPDGSIICSGVTTVVDSWGLLIKTDSLGNQQWLRTYYANPSNQNYIYDVKLTSDNGFIMTGSGNVTGQDAWVIKVDSNGCEIANCNVGVDELEISNSQLKLFPNPASSEINISIDGENINDYEISIINILGEIQKVKIENSKIPVSEFASGVYFVSAIRKDGKQRLSQKFVKE